MTRLSFLLLTSHNAAPRGLQLEGIKFIRNSWSPCQIAGLCLHVLHFEAQCPTRLNLSSLKRGVETGNPSKISKLNVWIRRVTNFVFLEPSEVSFLETLYVLEVSEIEI